MSGVLDDPNEQFLLSFNTDNDVKVVPNITIKIRNLFVPFFVNNSKNEMLVTINKTIANLPATYEFCVVSSVGLYLTFIQSSRVIFFP